MSAQEQYYIQQELQKRFPDLHDAFPFTDEKGDTLYQKCYSVYNGLDGNPMDWTLTEFRDPDREFQQVWLWRKKS